MAQREPVGCRSTKVHFTVPYRNGANPISAPLGTGGIDMIQHPSSGDNGQTRLAHEFHAQIRAMANAGRRHREFYAPARMLAVSLGRNRPFFSARHHPANWYMFQDNERPGQEVVMLGGSVKFVRPELIQGREQNVTRGQTWDELQAHTEQSVVGAFA